MIPAIVIIEPDFLVLHTPYQKDFVENLKLNVPWTLRSWDGTAKVWKVDPLFTDYVINLCEMHFGDVDVDDRRPAGPPALSGPATSNWADALFDAITDPELRTRVYRKVALALHPPLFVAHSSTSVQVTPEMLNDAQKMQQFQQAQAQAWYTHLAKVCRLTAARMEAMNREASLEIRRATARRREKVRRDTNGLKGQAAKREQGEPWT